MLVLVSFCEKRRYLEDGINVLGLPAGARIRWRYSSTYIEDSVSSGAFLRYRKLLLVFAKRSGTNISIVPVRYGRLVEMTEHGSVKEFVIKLEGFPAGGSKYSEHEPEAVDNLERYVSRLTMGKMVFHSGAMNHYEKGFPGTCDVESWEHVAGEVLRIGNYHDDVKFLYFMEVEKQFPLRSLFYGGGYKWESNTRVKIRLHHKVSLEGKKELENALGEVRLLVSGAELEFVSSSRSRIDSSRDSKLVELEVGSGYRVKRGHLAILVRKFTFSEENERTEESLSRHDIPISTGIFSPYIAAIASALAIGLAAIGVPDQGDNIETIVLFLFSALGAIGLSHGFR